MGEYSRWGIPKWESHENLNYYEYALIIMYKSVFDGGNSICKSAVVGGV